MKEKLAKLINVKSIITIVLCGVFAYLSVAGKVSAQQFLTIFTVIISFYFGSQVEKKRQVNRNAGIDKKKRGISGSKQQY